MSRLSPVRTGNADLVLTDQAYSANPLADRDTDQYRGEYITAFVDKWDALIDWDARAESEGDFFVDVLASRGKKTVLDAAAGTGFHSVRLIGAGFDVTSADGSAAMLARAFQNAKDRGLILKTVQADWRWLGQATRQRFDAIVCLGNSFTHLHDELDRRRVLAEFYAALEPDGVLIIDQRNYDTMLDQGFKSKHRYYYCGDQVSAAPVHIEEDLVRFEYSFPDGSQYTLNLNPVRKDYLRRLLREAGFQRIRTYGDFQATFEEHDPDFFIHVAEKSALAPMLSPSVSVTSNVSGRARVITEDYYNSDDADTFYSTIWGGEDLHLGIYDGTQDIREASFATVDAMAERIPGLGQGNPKAGMRIIDLGAGYGGSARRLATRFGAEVTCLNLSETQNDRNRLMTAQAGLTGQVEVVHGDFEDIPAPNDSYDVVWSQDALLHSGARDQVIAEAYRVLRPGGVLVFTDPMQTDDCPPDVLQPIYDRLYLGSLGAPGWYGETARRAGFEDLGFVDLSAHLITHYQRVHDELAANRAKVEEGASPDYIDRMLAGLMNWVRGGQAGHLTWGIFTFAKPG
ncbi:MAG: methyltransferase domain-containing protein [Pseudomonadota bacterium]